MLSFTMRNDFHWIFTTGNQSKSNERLKGTIIIRWFHMARIKIFRELTHSFYYHKETKSTDTNALAYVRISRSNFYIMKHFQ